MTFEVELERAILENFRSEDLGALATAIGETYPTVLIEVIDDLEARGLLDRDSAERLRVCRSREPAVMDDGLPIPHPLDGDWRLDYDSRRDLCRRISSIGGTEPSLLLGFPSVHREMQLAGHRSVLFDADMALANGHFARDTLILGDLSKLPPLLDLSSVVLADPPWYMPAIKHFLWFAARSTKVGASILLSLPGRLTRPGIDGERDEIFYFAETSGLRLVTIERHALRYVSPPFEVASLREVGLSGFPSAWRSGDLAVFKKESDVETLRPAPLCEGRWAEHVIEGVRIRFRLKQAECFYPVPIRLGKSSVRLSVSARDPVIHHIDIWTSGNQVFRCDSPSQLAVIAEAVVHGSSPVAMVERNLRRTLHCDERKLVERARAELGSIVNNDFTRSPL